MRICRGATAALLVAAAAACSEAVNPRGATTPSLADAFLSAPLGMGSTQSSFGDGGAPLGEDGGWVPGGEGEHGGPGGPGGHHRQGPGDGLMGGGLAGLLLGDGFGPGFGHGHHGDPDLEGSCAFDASTGWVTCEPTTHDSLTIERSARYLDGEGQVQPAFDSLTTNTIETRVSVSGVRTHRHDDATSTVESSSDRTVGGLAPGSARRTVNGTAQGRETTAGTDSLGSFTAVRVAGDTIAGVVIPVPTDGTSRPYPTAGSVTRSMTVTVTYSGQAATTASRREVITYDGSDTAQVVITQDGTTRTCSLPLPHGRPTCQ